jgi:hypothetical protein
MAVEFSKPGYILQGTTPLMFAESVTKQATPDDKMVKTLLQGMAGFSDGAEYIELDVKNAIPASGLEYDAEAAALNHQTQTLTFVVAGLAITGRGRITGVSTETSVDAPNSMSFKFTGKVLSRNRL